MFGVCFCFPSVLWDYILSPSVSSLILCFLSLVSVFIPPSHTVTLAYLRLHICHASFYFDNLCSVFSVLSFPFLCLVMSD